jgi:signal transduction histidine kinase
MPVFRTATPPLMMLVAVTASVLVTAIPSLGLEVESAAAGAIVIMARGLAELVVAIVAAHRFRRAASRIDFGIGLGLGVMAVADIALALGWATVDADGASSAAAVPYHVVGACVLAVTALASDRPVVRRARRGMVVGAVAVVALGVFILQHVEVVPGLHISRGSEPLAIDLLRIVASALLMTTAVGLVARRERRVDPLLRWLAAAVAIAALAQIERVAIPAPPTPSLTWVHVLQLAAVAALVMACVEEVQADSRRLAALAVSDERRRMSRELHDGVAQEVAYVASQAKHLAEQSADVRLELIAAAAQRALDDSRFVVGALMRSSGQPLSASIALQAQEFARRWGLAVELSLQPEVDVAPDKEEAILRIVGEALSNAARHANARTVNIRLGNVDGSLRVAVSDDGRGFDSDDEELAERGFGLRSMRERAQLVGGHVNLNSQPGAGTRVEIGIP